MLRLGYAAMQVEDWEAAAKAYRKYCIYESDVSNINTGCTILILVLWHLDWVYKDFDIPLSA